MFENVSTLFVTMNPLGSIPLVTALLKDLEPAERPSVIFTECLASLVIMLIFAFCGQSLLHALGISQLAIQAAGAVMLLKIAFEMSFPKGGGLGALFGLKPGERPFLIPIAMPCLSGPALLSQLIVLSGNAAITSCGLLTDLLVTWVLATAVMLASPLVLRYLGKKGLDVVERLMGLLLMMMSLDGLLSVVRKVLA